MSAVVTISVVADQFEWHRDRVLGVLYWQLGDVSYPEQGWSDNPIPVLTGWLDELRSLRVGGRRQLQFMEGCLPIAFSPNADDLCVVEPTGRKPVRVRTGDVRPAVAAAGKRVADWCAHHGHQSGCVDALVGALGYEVDR